MWNGSEAISVQHQRRSLVASKYSRSWRRWVTQSGNLFCGTLLLLYHSSVYTHETYVAWVILSNLAIQDGLVFFTPQPPNGRLKVTIMEILSSKTYKLSRQVNLSITAEFWPRTTWVRVQLNRLQKYESIVRLRAYNTRPTKKQILWQ